MCYAAMLLGMHACAVYLSMYVDMHLFIHFSISLLMHFSFCYTIKRLNS